MLVPTILLWPPALDWLELVPGNRSAIFFMPFLPGLLVIMGVLFLGTLFRIAFPVRSSCSDRSRHTSYLDGNFIYQALERQQVAETDKQTTITKTIRISTTAATTANRGTGINNNNNYQKKTFGRPGSKVDLQSPGRSTRIAVKMIYGLAAPRRKPGGSLLPLGHSNRHHHQG